MQKDFGITLLQIDGKPFKDNATMRTVCVNALLNEYTGETIDGATKLKRFKLAERISEEPAEDADPVLVDLKAEEVALVKDLVAKCYGPLVVGRVYEFLEGA